MKLVFFSNYLNHHQVLVADELYKRLGNEYCFVATLPVNKTELKGGADYSSRPYCILASQSEESHQKAIELAKDAEACVFGASSQEYAVERSRQVNCGLSFEYGERWLKRGWLNLLSPTLRLWWKNYFLFYRHKPFYKLCCSGFVSADDQKLRAYINRHYKWGYFTLVDEDFEVEASSQDASTSEIIPLMWCGRFLKLKHPELPVLMAAKLKEKGYNFRLDFYGSGSEENRTKKMVDSLGLNDVIKFYGALPNEEILKEMRKHQIFLFTSDKNEGWGAVANESMANGCVVVASDTIGSTPYLVEDGVNGFSFKSCDVGSLTEKVEWLLTHPKELQKMRNMAIYNMRRYWNPKRAADSLLTLIHDLAEGRDTSITVGPCSKA